MRIHEITNLDDYRQKKSSQAFTKKLQGLAASMPDTLRKSEEQTDWFNDRLKQIMRGIDQPFRSDRLRLAHLVKEYAPDTTMLDILYFDGDEDPIAQQFIRDNINRLQAAVAKGKSEIAALVAEADTMQWLAPFRRYTRLNETFSRLAHYSDMFAKIAGSR